MIVILTHFAFNHVLPEIKDPIAMYYGRERPFRGMMRVLDDNILYALVLNASRTVLVPRESAVFLALQYSEIVITSDIEICCNVKAH